jgi:hypothetical protein
LGRVQALVYAKPENPRALTMSIAKFLHGALAGGRSSARD